jgi:hypothetical protein
MQAFTIFYAWQSDRKEACCKHFIRLAAEAAAKKVAERLGVKLSIDADTEGVAGTPAITTTILQKIDDCDIFLADMTFVAKSDEGKLLPNPNVMGEYGYALKAKGLDRILLAMNTFFGRPEELPFDLHHLRHPAQYELAEGAPDSQRRTMRNTFSNRLEKNIGFVIDHLLKNSSQLAVDGRWDEAYAATKEFWQSRSARGRTVQVAGPRLVVSVVPLAALDRPQLNAAIVKAARPYFYPSPEARVKDGANEAEWWSSDPPTRRTAGQLNPESSWSFCLARPGFFEVSATIGERIDDDPSVVVEGRHIEGLLVDMVDRVAEVASSIGLAGPALVMAQLEGIDEVAIHRSRPGAGGKRIRRPVAWLGTARLANLIKPSGHYLGSLMEAMWLIGGWDDGSPYFLDGRWTGYETA